MIIKSKDRWLSRVSGLYANEVLNYYLLVIVKVTARSLGTEKRCKSKKEIINSSKNLTAFKIKMPNYVKI